MHNPASHRSARQAYATAVLVASISWGGLIGCTSNKLDYYPKTTSECDRLISESERPTTFNAGKVVVSSDVDKFSLGGLSDDLIFIQGSQIRFDHTVKYGYVHWDRGWTELPITYSARLDDLATLRNKTRGLAGVRTMVVFTSRFEKEMSFSDWVARAKEKGWSWKIYQIEASDWDSIFEDESASYAFAVLDKDKNVIYRTNKRAQINKWDGFAKYYIDRVGAARK